MGNASKLPVPPYGATVAVRHVCSTFGASGPNSWRAFFLLPVDLLRVSIIQHGPRRSILSRDDPGLRSIGFAWLLRGAVRRCDGL